VAWLKKDIPRPMSLVAVGNESGVCVKNPCDTLNGGCEDLCTVDERGNVACQCYAGMYMINRVHQARVAGFFSVKHTQNGNNHTKLTQKFIKCLQNITKFSVPRPSHNKKCDFGYANMPSGNPASRMSSSYFMARPK
jgi:hypothetical protein